MASEFSPFAGRVAIVTGAGSGLGRAHALLLARVGASVVINDLGTTPMGTGSSASAANAVVQEITQAGGTAVASYDSASTAAGARAIVEAAIDKFGRLDILINNAGTLRTAPLDELSDDDYAAMIDVHLHGPFYVTRLAFRAMKAQKYGRILFTSSSGGLFGAENLAGYAAGKAGLMGLMNVVAIEGAAHGIRSNLLLPASLTRMATDAPPYVQKVLAAVDRIGERRQRAFDPSYVSPLAIYLVSEECQSTHAIYTSVMGRYARIFLGVGPGWLGPTEAPASLQDIAAHFAEIATLAPFTIPQHIVEEFEDLADAVAARD